MVRFWSCAQRLQRIKLGGGGGGKADRGRSLRYWCMQKDIEMVLVGGG